MTEFLAALALAVGSWLHIAGGTWDPSQKSVAEARAHLEPYVKQQALIQRRKLPAWSKYSFQYQGRELKGNKLVYVNAFCTRPPRYATERLVRMLDGGPCYFSAYFDPRTKKFVGIVFNGFG